MRRFLEGGSQPLERNIALAVAHIDAAAARAQRTDVDTHPITRIGAIRRVIGRSAYTSASIAGNDGTSPYAEAAEPALMGTVTRNTRGRQAVTEVAVSEAAPVEGSKIITYRPAQGLRRARFVEHAHSAITGVRDTVYRGRNIPDWATNQVRRIAEELNHRIDSTG